MAMPMMQPTIVLLKDGTDTSQGLGQLLSNINACQAVVDVIRTTLGPRGMDKMVHSGGKVTISNDGATIMQLLEIVHPAAGILVDIAKSQDAEVGDGTTSVVILAGELLKASKGFLEEGVHPQTVIKGYRAAVELAMDYIQGLAVDISGKSIEERNRLLERVAATALNSKLISGHKEFFAKTAVQAVLHLEGDLNLDMIGMKKVQGGSLADSLLVHGVAFKKTFSYAGFEQQPKKFQEPKILLLNVELELKAEKDNAEVRIDDPKKYQEIVDAEWDVIYSKLDKIVESGATIVLSRLAIGDLATQYFADRDIFCAGRVADEDMSRMIKAVDAQVQTTVSDLNDDCLGHCALLEERQIGAERYNIFSGCPLGKTATIILRGGSEQFLDEADRCVSTPLSTRLLSTLLTTLLSSLHDAIMVVRRAIKHAQVVAGGGAIEMELSKMLRDHSRTIMGKQQLIINAFAKSLEIIPRQISDNAGFDSTDILNKLRMKHAQPDAVGKWFGVDIAEEGICDTFDSFVWEPALIKINALQSAVEAACTVLSVDETVRNPQSEQPGAGGPGGRGGGRGRGRGMPRR